MNRKVFDICAGEICCGTLQIESSDRKPDEEYRFKYHPSWLLDKKAFPLSPDVPLSDMEYFCRSIKPFGFLSDISPERWGRSLISRFLSQNGETIRNSSFFLEVQDEMRTGAVRIFDAENKSWQRSRFPVPPETYLPSLSFLIGKAADAGEPDTHEGLKQLLGICSSLGGARPKCNVKDSSGNLWIAKFCFHGSVEMKSEYACLKLARSVGIQIPDIQYRETGNGTGILLSRRFDRNGADRIPYISGMSLLCLSDGFSSEEGGYLSLFEEAQNQLNCPDSTGAEIWRRMVANILLHNTDDHLRNHAFLYLDSQWKPSPAYDITFCEEGGSFHALPVYAGGSCHENDMLADAVEYAGFFGVDEALSEIDAMFSILEWNIGQTQMPARHKNALLSHLQKQRSIFKSEHG